MNNYGGSLVGSENRLCIYVSLILCYSTTSSEFIGTSVTSSAGNVEISSTTAGFVLCLNCRAWFKCRRACQEPSARLFFFFLMKDLNQNLKLELEETLIRHQILLGIIIYCNLWFW